MRGKKGENKRKNMRMVRPKDKGSDESDEDYNVSEDEEFDESDDEYGLIYDVDETEEIMDLLEDGEEFVQTKMKKVGRPNVKKAGCARGTKNVGVMKPKKRRILHREEDEEEEEDDGDGDDEDYDFDDEMTNKVVKPQKKKRVSFREEDDDYACAADDDFEDKKVNGISRRRKRKRVSYRDEEDDDDYNGVADDSSHGKVISVVKPRGKRRVSYREKEEDDDYNGTDDDIHDERVNSVARGKKRVSYGEEDDDDYNGSDDDMNDERVNSVVKPRGKKRVSYREEEEDDDDDDRGSDDILNDEKVNSVVKVSYGEEDDDYDVIDDQSDDEKVSKVAKPSKGKEVSYREEEDEDDDNDYYGADDDEEKVVLAVKPRGKRRVSYRVEEDEDDDDDDDDEYSDGDDKYDDGKVNLIVKPRGKRRVSYRVEDDDDYDVADGEFDDEKVNLVVKPRGKRTVSYKEDDVDYDGKDGNFDDEEKVIEVANQRKKKGVSYREEDDDYDGMDDDDEDEDDDYDATDDDDDYEEEEEAFTPNEIDGVDDEEELRVMKEKKKLDRQRLQGKCVIGGWKTKGKRNSNVSNKTSINKPIKNHQSTSKRETGKDNAMIKSKPVVEAKKEKVNERRRRGRVVHSDSDFVFSGSSDHEYTISEEEREQIHEANKFCRSLTTSLRNSTSSSKLDEEEKIPTRRKRLARKGKEKVEDLKVEVVKQVCGICLTEEGKRTVRGTLNCCSHYFCFACIMEWSKVESRCPLCKQRFGTISKPARSNTGFDLRTAVIQIPERDQVYQPSEEELLGFLDPYDYVICTECHHGGDDALMLLCDLCDSPAHTYCVGLGREVPEGNWYCEGCRPAALGSSNPQPHPHPHVSTPRPSSPVSGIRETFDLNEMYVPETPLIHASSQLPSPRPSVGDIQLPSPAFGSGAFTVLERRRIQHQIHHLLRRQMDLRAPDTPATVSGHSLFGPQVDWSRELATQHVVTPEMVSANNIYFHGSLLANTAPIFQSPEVPSARLTHIGGHLTQNQPSMSTNGSFSGYIQNEFDGLNSSIGLRLGHQQLQPCSSRSNTGSDANTSSYPFREGTVPSVTLQDALRTRF